MPRAEEFNEKFEDAEDALKEKMLDAAIRVYNQLSRVKRGGDVNPAAQEPMAP